MRMDYSNYQDKIIAFLIFTSVQIVDAVKVKCSTQNFQRNKTFQVSVSKALRTETNWYIHCVYSFSLFRFHQSVFLVLCFHFLWKLPMKYLGLTHICVYPGLHVHWNHTKYTKICVLVCVRFTTQSHPINSNNTFSSLFISDYALCFHGILHMALSS